MDSIPGFISSALGIVAIAGLAALGFMRGTLTNLREQLKDSRDETKAVKETRDEDRAQLVRVTADLAALTRVVTGETHWVAIGQKLDEHHDAAESHWVKDEAILTQILAELRRPT